KRAGQVYLNTWHGVPLKLMGFDMPDGGLESRNVVRNFLNADYLLSANPYMTETMYRGAYRLQGIFRGAVIEEGQPRTDRQAETVLDPGPVRRLLSGRGIDLGDRSVVLYAPTWRGERFGTPNVNASQLLTTVREIQKSLDPATHVVLLKVHQVIYEAVRARVGDDCDFLVPNNIPTNLVLGVSDLLVTDYSSIFFDFLSTGRPVIHYVPDLDDYRSGRGLYLTEDELAGPVCATVHDLVEQVSAKLVEPLPAKASAAAAEVYDPKDDGSVCARVVDLVFGGADESRYAVRRDFTSDRQTLLVYLGSMKSQGITTSALNLLRHLDYDRFDVTVFFPMSRLRDRVRNMRLVDPRARAVVRVPVFNGTRRRVREETDNLMKRGLPEQLDARHTAFWRDEWQRVFGHAQFDHLLDFSGYGCYTPFLYSVAETGQRSIWLHNDMYADMQRETVGEKHLEDRLTAVFSTYRHFDHLVSVSPELERVNRAGLAAYASPERFTHAINTMDGERVQQMAGHGHGGSAAGPHTEPFDTGNVAAAVGALLEHFTPHQVIREARSRQRLADLDTGSDSVVFVSVGRLSPEKNHARLIKAFARVHEEHPHVRLVVLGGGKLEESLEALIVELGLESHVVLAGQVDNPYAIMARSDCFVLSSDYEGQPMVILEARTLGLPIVTTAFSSVGDSVPADAGMVVPQTVKGVASGMRAFLGGRVPSSFLDYHGYNEAAIEQFYAAISGGGGPSQAVQQDVDHAR
ncbi:MAG: glycosyltransferase, partial [Nocardioidaceae bacterium]